MKFVVLSNWTGRNRGGAVRVDATAFVTAGRGLQANLVKLRTLEAPMIDRIKTHNILNGIIFSIVEFIIAALIIAPFAIYYVVHGRVLYATIAIGIILSCLTIVAFGIQQRKNKVKDVGIQHMFDKNVRERISREYPHLNTDTSVLLITLLLPFVTFLWALGEILFNRGP
jgi:hypothetical protein